MAWLRSFFRKLTLQDRIHLFEFEDLAWYPDLFRDYMTDILGFQVKYGIYSKKLAARIAHIMTELDRHEMVDLCSGSGLPAIALHAQVTQITHKPIVLLLTDKYPNRTQFQSHLASKKDIIIIDEPIDILQVNFSLRGFRTLFAAFHHFKPPQAQQILQNIVDANAPIGIFEFTERNWFRAFLVIFGFLHIFLITPFIKPFSWKRLFWTYIIPVVPLVYFWDGFVSNLRTYRVPELKNMTRHLHNADQFKWEIARMHTKVWFVSVVYLIGYPLDLSEHAV